MNLSRIVPSLLALAGLAFCTAASAADQPQAAVPLKPITKKLTFIYIPKLVHPWYEEVKRGVEYGIQEVKKEGIDVEYIWDAPAEAGHLVTPRRSAARANRGDHGGEAGAGRADRPRHGPRQDRGAGGARTNRGLHAIEAPGTQNRRRSDGPLRRPET